MFLLCLSVASAHAADMYSGIGAHGEVVVATAPAAPSAELPLAQRLAAQARRLGALADRWSSRPAAPTAAAERPLRPEPVSLESFAEADAGPAGAFDAERGADFRFDLGMSTGRPRVTTPRNDPRSQLTPADLDGDPAVLRDEAGRIRRVPQLSVGVRVKF